ncbi:MAG: hypothetical protein AAB590_01305 [Patescibacteria group bacterium]
MKYFLLSVIIVASGMLISSAYAAVYLSSPSTCSGSWASCNYAFSSNDFYAQTSGGYSGIWGDYGFNISTTTGTSTASTTVQIGVEGKAAVCPGSAVISVAISRDGGANFGPYHSRTFGCADSMEWVDVTNDYSPWSASDFSNANLKVKAKCEQGGVYCDLDWLPVKVDIP